MGNRVDTLDSLIERAFLGIDGNERFAYLIPH